jgi:hypothetical protein
MQPQFLFTLDTRVYINVASIVRTSRLKTTKQAKRGDQVWDYYKVWLTDGTEHAVDAEQFESITREGRVIEAAE